MKSTFAPNNALLRLSCLTVPLSAALTLPSAYGSADYGPAIWTPACNGHWYTSGVGKQFYVIHDMEGYYLSTIAYFQNCGTSASVHYCANGLQDTGTDHPAGEITQMVADVNYAWHVGCWNTHCMGTEHEGFANNPAWYSEAMYQASAALTHAKADKYGFAKDRNHIVGHGEWQNANWRTYASANFGIDTSCNTHTDPGPYWDWNHYMSLVGGTGGGTWNAWYVPVAGFSANAPTIVSTGNGTLSEFIVGGDNAIWQLKWTGTGWQGWSSLGGTATSAPAACSRGNGLIDLVVRSTDNNIWMNNFNGSSWSGWYVPVTGFSANSPSIVSTGGGALSVFIVGGDSAVWQLKWTGSAWQGWYSMGGVATSAPSACSRSAGAIDLVVRSTDNNIYMKNFSGSWNSWYVPVAGYAASAPNIVSTGNGTLSIFIEGGDASVYQLKWTGSGWQGWSSLSGTATSAPAACSRAAGAIDLVIRSSDNNIWMKNFQ